MSLLLSSTALAAAAIGALAWAWNSGYKAGKYVGRVAEQKRLRDLAEFNGPCCIERLAHFGEPHREGER